jgi:NAD(P)-dependent dehydrogenase (short-subunit alcohol dehydrogenase family)
LRVLCLNADDCLSRPCAPRTPAPLRASGSTWRGDLAGEVEVRQMVEATVPPGRQSAPREVAATVASMVSANTSYVSGHALVVDGGLTAVRMSLKAMAPPAVRDATVIP